jgi:hypothetical protein
MQTCLSGQYAFEHGLEQWSGSSSSEKDVRLSDAKPALSTENNFARKRKITSFPKYFMHSEFFFCCLKANIRQIEVLV